MHSIIATHPLGFSRGADIDFSASWSFWAVDERGRRPAVGNEKTQLPAFQDELSVPGTVRRIIQRFIVEGSIVSLALPSSRSARAADSKMEIRVRLPSQLELDWEIRRDKDVRAISDCVHSELIWIYSAEAIQDSQFSRFGTVSSSLWNRDQALRKVRR